MLVRYIDLVLVLLAAPILLLIGVPAVGYGIGAGTWIVLRGIGIALDRYVEATARPNQAITLRLAFLLCRLFMLALAVILVRRGAGRDDGLTALLVIVFAFTMGLVASVANRPRSK